MVYEALDRERGTRVALKTLRSVTAQALAELKREFRAMQGVHHPNLVSLGELVAEGRRVFLHDGARPEGSTFSSTSGRLGLLVDEPLAGGHRPALGPLASRADDAGRR